MALDIQENEHDRALVRAARPPSSGVALVANGAARGTVDRNQLTTVVDADGNVRRLWQPGDPWDDNFYFGGSSEDSN